MRESTGTKILSAVGSGLDRVFGWYRLPKPLGIISLIGVRDRLRQKNLFDTGPEGVEQPAVDPNAPYMQARTLDGSYNDLETPTMGRVGCRFGRNIPLPLTYPQPEPAILHPSPREVSRQLLTRDTFIPATTLNLLAAAWLQFEVHDWFSHPKGDQSHVWSLPLAEEDPWPEHPMRIQRTPPDPTGDPAQPPVYQTEDSHWWDGSQIYGTDPRFAAKLRSTEDGKLRIDENGLLPADLEEGVDLSGVAGNFWVGLGLLHTLFSLEHNAICDRLKEAYPGWSDQQLFDKARLVNAALMAKIHTVEWTPAIIAHPTTKLAMNANWWGLVGERITKKRGRISKSEVISGIPGSSTNHHGVPYSLTEEFVAVYRMHPLIPDDYTFRSVADDRVIEERTFEELGVRQTRERLTDITMPNALYSFGVSHPGAVTLHNYPRFLQDLERPDGTRVDLAALDVLRVRERGVPRYNEFRRLFHLRPAKDFDDLTDNPVWAKEIREVYGGKVDDVDLMVGLYGEPLPKGFGFSDTAFRVFVLMASRRLKSDRFFTKDYTPGTYTPEGMQWLNDNTFGSVLVRHYPSLAPSLAGVANAFTPWKPARASEGQPASSTSRRS